MKVCVARPWEGLDQEVKENKRQEAYAEEKADAKLHDTVSKAYADLSPDKKKALAG